MDGLLAMLIGVAIADSLLLAYSIVWIKFYGKNRQAEELKPIDVTKYNVTENGNVVVKDYQPVKSDIKNPVPPSTGSHVRKEGGGKMTKDLAEWIVKAIETVQSGVADKLEKDNVKVYRVVNVIRIDYKE